MPPRKAAAANGTTSAVQLEEDPTAVNPDGMSSSRTTHSREKIKLCEQTVLNHFGPVAAKVASVLLQRGRISLKELQRFLDTQEKAAAPPRSQVLHTLMILIQHNVLYHIRLDVDGSIIDEIDEPGGTEYFEINPDAILVRTRFGTFIEQAERLWGQEGLHVARLILENGKIQVSDLLSQMPSTSTSTRPLITHMILSAYILPSAVLSHISPHDLRIAYTNEAKRHFKGIPAAKDLRNIDEDVKERIARERENTRGTGYRKRDERDVGQARCSAGGVNGRYTNGSAKASAKTKKRRLAVDSGDEDSDTSGRGRKSKSSTPMSKRGKAQPNGSTASGTSAAAAPWMATLSDLQKQKLDEVIVTDATYVRLNYDRFDVHIRNEVLFNLMSSTFNATAAGLYSKLIDYADVRKSEEAGVGSAWPSVSDRSSEQVSLTLVSSALGSSLQLNKGFDKSMFMRLSTGKTNRPSTYEFVAEYVALLSRTEDSTASSAPSRAGPGGEAAAATSAQRFLIPGTTNADVATPTGSRVSSSFRVDFAAAGRRLKWSLLKQTVEGVFGETEARVLGVLRREGKLEEKHVSKLALLSLTETREACERLFSCSIIALQEIPKSADRAPQKTFFLYYLDYPKALAWLSDRIYRTQARISQRRMAEREKYRSLLNKAERTDVKKEGVEKVLSKVEMLRLKDCQDRLRLLTIAEARVERQSWVLARMPL